MDKFLAEADEQIALQQQSLSGTDTESENSSSQLFDQVVDPNQTSSQTSSTLWSYNDYTATAMEEARTGGRTIVLFFYNGWDASSVNLDIQSPEAWHHHRPRCQWQWNQKSTMRHLQDRRSLVLSLDIDISI